MTPFRNQIVTGGYELCLLSCLIVLLSLLVGCSDEGDDPLGGGDGSGGDCGISVATDTGYVPFEVQLDAWGSGGTPPYTYEWDFGDGTTSANKFVQHEYDDGGTFAVLVTVTDANDQQCVSYHRIVALPGQPVALFDIIPMNNSIHAEDTLRFDASRSYDPTGQDLAYEWALSDGSVSAGVLLDHVFESEGSYVVTLTVTDPDGLADTCRVVQTILEPFPRAIIHHPTHVFKEGMVFGVVPRATVKHWPNPYVYLEVEIRNADTTGWSNVHPADDDRQIHMSEDPYEYIDTVLYGPFTGALFWPSDSALVIVHLYRNESKSDTLASDTTHVTVDNSVWP